MLRNSATLKILGFGIIFGVLFAAVDLFNTSPEQIPPFSVGRWILRSSIAGFLGAFVGFVYHLATLKDGTHAEEKTRERIPFVSDRSFDTTREGGLVYLDYKGLSTAKLNLMLAIYISVGIGGCVPALKAEAPGMYFLFVLILTAVFWLSIRPTHKTITIKRGEYIDGEYRRIGADYISSITSEGLYVLRNQQRR